MKTNGQNFWIYIIHENEPRQTSIMGREFDSQRMKLEKDGTLTVKATPTTGFAWDGCTPKIAFLDLVWGVPDGVVDHNTEKRKAYYASLYHDVLYQFGKQAGVKRKEADDLFFEILKESRFFWRHIYYVAVRLFGGLLYGRR